MKTRFWLAITVLLALASADYALTPPSAAEGPIKLLACVVTPGGKLEASVESQTDDTMSCNIRCNYELGGRMFSHTFSESIPGRFTGRIGQFDTNNAKAGNYTGEMGTCSKVER